MQAFAGSYGWEIDWKTDDDLTAATAAEFLVTVKGSTAQTTLAATLAEEEDGWHIRHTVQPGAFPAGVYRIRPAVQFGPTVRLLAAPQALVVAP